MNRTIPSTSENPCLDPLRRSMARMGLTRCHFNAFFNGGRVESEWTSSRTFGIIIKRKSGI